MCLGSHFTTKDTAAALTPYCYPAWICNQNRLLITDQRLPFYLSPLLLYPSWPLLFVLYSALLSILYSSFFLYL